MSDRRLERLDPRALQTVLLDEVAGRLADVTNLLARQLPKGVVENYSLNVSGSNWQRISSILEPWFSVSIVNTSLLYPAYIKINDKKTKEYSLLPGNTYHVDLKQAKIKNVYYRASDSGAVQIDVSTVR